MDACAHPRSHFGGQAKRERHAQLLVRTWLAVSAAKGFRRHAHRILSNPPRPKRGGFCFEKFAPSVFPLALAAWKRNCKVGISTQNP